MDNALGEPQSIVLLGGTSEIGLEIVRALVTPATRRIVLACRDVAAGRTAADLLADGGFAVDVIEFDAAAPATHGALAASITADRPDIDVVVVAFGLLGDGAVTSRDPVAAAEIATVNFTGAVSSIVAFAEILRRQGHGAIVALSSVAGERVRKANPVYGATKAGIDAFCQALGDGLVADGVHVLVVHPGFVHTAMTAGLKAAPLATSAERVAAVTIAGLRNRRRVVWAPPILRYVFIVLRHLPAPVWRRLPFD